MKHKHWFGKTLAFMLSASLMATVLGPAFPAAAVGVSQGDAEQSDTQGGGKIC